MPLPVLEREIGGMLQLARRSAPGTFNRSGADPVANTSPDKRDALIVRDLDFTAADIDLGCRAVDLQGNAPIATPRHRLKLDILRCGFSRQHRRQQHAVVCEPRLIADHRMAWRPNAHPVSSSTSRAAAIPLPTITSGSLTGYPYSAHDCDHMLRKSCSRTACHKRCPTHPPLPASSHPPGPSPASTATRRRPPDSAPPSHRS